MRFPRTAGILLHPTSFPGRYGIGDLGAAAYRFVDFMVEARQSIWQILPLGPTGYGDSPYQSFCTFAGNPMLISPDLLVADGFLPETAVTNVPPFPAHTVDFGPVIKYKEKLLAQSFDHFEANATAAQQAAFEQFCAAEAGWLDDYAFFMALKDHHVEHEGGVWNTWPTDIAQRRPDALAEWGEKLARQVTFRQYLQFLFYEQWFRLKGYANERGIKIVGDVPIFVAFDSADVWANQELFYLDETGAPTVVAGVPPDYFSETGQRWGNPLYRWDKMAERNYDWWRRRLEMTFRQTDIVRIDHFRGFEAYWEVPASEPTAMVGEWVKGPDKAFFQAMREQLGELPLIAEDLGVITPEVQELRDTFDFPGMKILQFAFGGAQENHFLPHNYDTPNCVVYTGTHDNETTRGWYENAADFEKDRVRRYLAVDGHDPAWDLIRLAFMSVADTAVIPLQDIMNLGNEARMNFPGKASGNWGWRYQPHQLTQPLALRLRDLTEIYSREPAQNNA
jgi:4-alpha-glucanotransferase